MHGAATGRSRTWRGGASGWARGKADVVYVAGAFVMEKVNALAAAAK